MPRGQEKKENETCSWWCERPLGDGSPHPWEAAPVSAGHAAVLGQRTRAGYFWSLQRQWCCSRVLGWPTLCWMLKRSICAAGCKAGHWDCNHHTACAGGSSSEPSGNQFWPLHVRLEQGDGTPWQRKTQHPSYFTEKKSLGIFPKNTNSRQWPYSESHP